MGDMSGMVYDHHRFQYDDSTGYPYWYIADFEGIPVLFDPYFVENHWPKDWCVLPNWDVA